MGHGTRVIRIPVSDKMIVKMLLDSIKEEDNIGVVFDLEAWG